jgi:predicted signal transduction protein with EAL and GGDEF domain
VARIGGDEFTMILNGVSGVEAVEQMAQRLLQEIRLPVIALTSETQVSASIGISMYPEHGQDPTSLVRNADLAMYHAKGRGKSCWQIYAPELGAVFRKRMSIERNLEGAIADQELEVYYQAQTDAYRHVLGFEALVRWNNPVVGVVSPEVFIPVAEESGLIIPIGDWVLRQACSQSAAWSAAGHPAPRVAVNVSARQLAQDDFVSSVQHALEDSSLPPHCLELELTETALMKNLDDCVERLTQLRNLGVSISIDDFGTGYSSLSYLQKLPVTSLKIDKSFVREITEKSKNTLPLIQAIVDLAHGLGLHVVAEGVETERQLHALRNAGCDMVQGYLLHRPQPAREVEALLARSTSDLLRLGETLESDAGARVLETTERARRRRTRRS